MKYEDALAIYDKNYEEVCFICKENNKKIFVENLVKFSIMYGECANKSEFKKSKYVLEIGYLAMGKFVRV